MPTITLKFKENIIGHYALEQGDSLSIGRQKDNDIVIDNLAVSGHHAKVESVGEEFVLVDLQSKNGSFVNEQLVTSHWLRNGDNINIGKHVLHFSSQTIEGVPDKGPRAIRATMIMDTSKYRSMVEKSAPVIPKPLSRPPEVVGLLSFLAGGQGELKLTPLLVKIGRDPRSEIVVKGLFVGKTAATISRRPDGYYLSSAGGFFKPRVNNQAVKQSVMLKDMDIIGVGSVKLQFFLKPL
jgi:pSer/pThr/pTyr-binding forkhead associated (FHA) protein